jgi:transcriptional regulator with XRE-family HTH domain
VSVFARSVGRNLRRRRQEAGLSKRALAERAGLDRTVVVAYEGGHGVPILQTFVVLAMALGLSPCSLLPGLEWDPGEAP